MALKHQDLIDKLSIEEKISLLSGDGFFTSKEINKINLSSVTFADGPNGVRLSDTANPTNLNSCTPSTCFPSLSMMSSSWDTELLEEYGKTLGEEAVSKKVGVILAPGMNIKRSPLCGRNFEYFSEDPLLAGELAGSYVKGIQSTGVSATLKHFAANNQETRRMVVDAVIDERTMREIYLRPFEIAIAKGSPGALMCAYNRLNGVYCCENEKLLTDILRKEWNYQGLVMSDWGATNDRVAGVKAGLELEMPGNGGLSDPSLLAAVADKSLDEAIVNQRVDVILEFLLHAAEVSKKEVAFDETLQKAHSDQALKFAEQSAVLLKNNGNVLPLKKNTKVLVVGEMAKKPRIQGAGSSHITPTFTSTILDELTAAEIPYDYQQGYELSATKPSNKLIKQCTTVAMQYPKIIACVGLPADKELEGLDRTVLALPESQTRLLYDLSKYNKNVIVVVTAGAPITMPWIDFVQSALLMYLPGQMGNKACARLLVGDVNPSGKLAESYPNEITDISCKEYYPGDMKRSLYRESVYVGYRYYDSAKVKVLYPFGYGLSYSTFKYSDLKLSRSAIKDTDKVDVSVTVENTSDVDGSEVVQVYVNDVKSTLFRPVKELKGFKKVLIKAHTKEVVKIPLDKAAFSFYNVTSHSWMVESGEFMILVGTNSADLQLSAKLTVTSTSTDTVTDLSADCKWYYEPTVSAAPMDQFEKLYGSKIATDIPIPAKGAYTNENTLEEMCVHSVTAKMVLTSIRTAIMAKLKALPTDNTVVMFYETLKCCPVKNLTRASMGIISQKQVDGIVTMCNGSLFTGMKSLF